MHLCAYGSGILQEISKRQCTLNTIFRSFTANSGEIFGLVITTIAIKPGSFSVKEEKKRDSGRSFSYFWKRTKQT